LQKYLMIGATNAADGEEESGDTTGKEMTSIDDDTTTPSDSILGQPSLLPALPLMCSKP